MRNTIFINLLKKFKLVLVLVLVLLVLIILEPGIRARISKLVITSSTNYVTSHTRTAQIIGFQCG
jgi:hypothetical protein